MIKTSWAKTPPKTVLEVQFPVKISRLVKFRGWLAKKLILLAAQIINSRVVFKKTLSVLELE